MTVQTKDFSLFILESGGLKKLDLPSEDNRSANCLDAKVQRLVKGQWVSNHTWYSTTLTTKKTQSPVEPSVLRSMILCKECKAISWASSENIKVDIEAEEKKKREQADKLKEVTSQAQEGDLNVLE